VTKAHDFLTGELFAEIPQAAPTTPGAINYSREIAATMSQALKDSAHDRIEVSARMSRMLGREVSLSMLNAYTAGSDETHNISLERAIAFDAATDGHALLNFFSAKRGCRVMVGEDALLAELGRIERSEQVLRERKAALKAYLGRKR
jgi:hypothetical protein